MPCGDAGSWPAGRGLRERGGGKRGLCCPTGARRAAGTTAQPCARCWAGRGCRPHSVARPGPCCRHVVQHRPVRPPEALSSLQKELTFTAESSGNAGGKWSRPLCADFLVQTFTLEWSPASCKGRAAKLAAPGCPAGGPSQPLPPRRCGRLRARAPGTPVTDHPPPGVSPSAAVLVQSFIRPRRPPAWSPHRRPASSRPLVAVATGSF